MPTYKNIAAIWVKKDKNNNSFLSFKAESDIKQGDSINLFKNDKGDNPARPDFRAYIKIEDEQSQPVNSESVASDVPF